MFVCLRLALAKHTVDGAAYAARASSRGDALFRGLLRRSASPLCVRWCAAAKPAEPLPHNANKVHCISVYA